jgi:hypothetical protein
MTTTTELNKSIKSFFNFIFQSLSVKNLKRDCAKIKRQSSLKEGKKQNRTRDKKIKKGIYLTRESLEGMGLTLLIITSQLVPQMFN